MQAAWGSNGSIGGQRLIADLGSTRPVSQILVGGSSIVGWGGVNHFANARLEYFDGTTWQTIAILGSLARNNWHLVVLTTPVNTTQVGLDRPNGWAATNNLRVGHQ